MKIKVQNNAPGVKASVKQNPDGPVFLSEPLDFGTDGFLPFVFGRVGKKLGSVKSGSTVKLGKREYIVLGHSYDNTAVITKDVVKSVVFGRDGDYSKSNVRAYCNDEFYRELCKAVGAENIVPHTVALMSDDGSNKGATVKDNVSILTNDLYRRYREFLPAIGATCWTATRVTTSDEDYARAISIVGCSGILGWSYSGDSCGVRPYCVLKSSVFVS